MTATPFELIWKPFAPLLDAVASLQGVIDTCALYLPWCAMTAVALATVTLAGIVLTQRSSREASSEPVSVQETVPA
ncbi:MAG: hypothetical protein GVY35_12650 [Bacteroidetes bacterium]|jgi:hypothetical protein|nr:hypothetical protein [Bacteroidota bacterium]